MFSSTRQFVCLNWSGLFYFNFLLLITDLNIKSYLKYCWINITKKIFLNSLYFLFKKIEKGKRKHFLHAINRFYMFIRIEFDQNLK